VPDKYRTFAELHAAEPESYAIDSRDRATEIVVVAPHGGGIELGTSEIALAIAGDDLSYYVFEGRKDDENGVLHITSTNFDEPRGLALLRSAHCAIAIHGEGSEKEVVYLGGRNDSLKSAIGDSLAGKGYVVREHADAGLQGLDKRNICNIGRAGAGVQLELSKGLRQLFFATLTRAGRKETTDRFDEFCGLVREAIGPRRRAR